MKIGKNNFWTSLIINLLVLLKSNSFLQNTDESNEVFKQKKEIITINKTQIDMIKNEENFELKITTETQTNIQTTLEHYI